jgi:hypothetical protein
MGSSSAPATQAGYSAQLRPARTFACIIVDQQKARACAVAAAAQPHHRVADGLPSERGVRNGVLVHIHNHAALVRIHSCHGVPVGLVSHAALVRIHNRSEVLDRIRSRNAALVRHHSRSEAVGRSHSHAVLAPLHAVLARLHGRSEAVVGRSHSHAVPARLHNRSEVLGRIRTGVLVRVRIHGWRVNRSRLSHRIHSHNRKLRARLLDRSALRASQIPAQLRDR